MKKGSLLSGSLLMVLLAAVPASTQTQVDPATDQTYVAMVLGIASAADKDYINLNNAINSGANLYIRKVYGTVDSQAAVIGLQPGFTVSRYTTAGVTSCTAGSIAALDSQNAPIPTEISVSTGCTTDPTGLTNLGVWSFYADETNPSTQVMWEQSPGGQPIVIRQGQGLTLDAGATAPVGVISLMIEFTR